MQPYILFSLIATVCFSLSALLNKFTSKHAIDNKNSMMAFFMLFSFLFSGVLFGLMGKVSFPSIAILPFFVTVTTFTIGYYLFYTGVFKTDASSFAPLFQLQAVFITILAFIFLNERFPAENYLWIILVLLGAVCVSLDEKMSLRSFFAKGVLIIIAMQIFHAISNLFVGITLKYVSPLEILFWQYITLGVLFFPFVMITRPKLNYRVQFIIPSALATWISAIGAVFLFEAFKVNLTIPSTIALLTSPIVFIFTFLASIFKPGLLEHHTKKVYFVRAVGVVLILIGVLHISKS